MSYEDIIGPRPGRICADLVRRVLEMAFDDGHDDPRHGEHWWAWEDWPLDGRQWEYEGEINRYKIEKKMVAEHERRAEEGSGMGLIVERKLEGSFWGDKKYPGGRTSLRSTGMFWAPPAAEGGDGLDDDGLTVDGRDEVLRPLFEKARSLEERCSYDASIKPHGVIKDMPLKFEDELKRDFQEARPFDGHGYFGVSCDELEVDEEHTVVCQLASATYYMCTDAFATRGEQESDEVAPGVPSISVSAVAVYVDPCSGDIRKAFVVAEGPMRGFDGCMVEHLHDRVAGFVFMINTTDGDPDAVDVRYVESCRQDLQTLEEDAKDALLEDRALIVNRLMLYGADAGDRMVTIASPNRLPAMKPPPVGFPPTRTLSTMMTVHRADPRWPLAKPNSLCLECGKDPKEDGSKLLQCTKCRVRTFCSSECMAKSWKSDTWCHRLECKRLCDHQQSQVGKSMREGFEKLLQDGHIPCHDAEAQMSLLEKHLGPMEMDMKYGSMEEMREKQRENARGARKARKNKKKGKGKKK